MNKRGFTLIEIIAVIALLGIMVLAVFPMIGNSISNRKETQYNNIITTIKNAAKVYYANNQDTEVISMETLIAEDYLSSGIVNPVTGESINGCISVGLDQDGYNIYTYYDDCNVVAQKVITLNLNGGTSGQTLNSSYLKGDTINLVVPTKSGYAFDYWSATCATCISGNVYTVGKYNDTIAAVWKGSVTLTVNLNGGSTTQTFNATYVPGSTITLTIPIKSGYVFNGWTVSGTGSSVNANVLTIGSANTTITANWLAFASMFTYTGSSTLINDGSGNWRIKFLTSGTFTPLVNMTIDAFLVGGGGGGNCSAGGGGGYVNNYTDIVLSSGTAYTITIGNGGNGAGDASASNGGASSAFSHTANGGNGAGNGLTAEAMRIGGHGGSGGGGGYATSTTNVSHGGAGGTNGSNGSDSYTSTYGIGGTGQGTTTREFAEPTGDLYAGGGGGGVSGGSSSNIGGAGGALGGGLGYGYRTSGVGGAGTANTGGGGGGGGGTSTARLVGGAGGSGIIIIRNAR